MPLYEYKCFDCDARFDKLTRIEQADAVACPECGSSHARRLISVVASFGRASGDDAGPVAGGGCGCGGHCSCGGH